MRIIKRYFAVIAAVLCLASCGKITDSSESPAKETIAAAPAAALTKPASSASPESDPETSSAEEYPENYSLEINDPDAPQVTSVSLKVSKPDGMCTLENVYKTDVLATGTVGLVGCPVSVGLKAKLGELSFAVDPDKLGDLPLENLAVLKTGQGKSFEVVPFRKNDNSIACVITGSDTYMLVDLYQWNSAWGGDVSGLEHETEFTVREDFNFRITLPKGVAPNNTSDYWHEEFNGQHKMMCKQLMQQNRQKASDVKAELYAWRYPNENDNCDDPAPVMSFDDKVNEISSLKSDRFTVETAETWDLNNGRKGFVAVFRFPGDPDKGINEQTGINAYYEYADDTYIAYTLSFSGHDKDTTDRCISSAKSFVCTEK